MPRVSYFRTVYVRVNKVLLGIPTVILITYLQILILSPLIFS